MHEIGSQTREKPMIHGNALGYTEKHLVDKVEIETRSLLVILFSRNYVNICNAHLHCPIWTIESESFKKEILHLLSFSSW